MEKEGVRERLIQFIEYKGMKTLRFEKTCGLSTGYVNNIRQSVQPDKLMSIVHNFPELNVSWLMLGEEHGGPMIKEGSPAEVKAKPVEEKTREQSKGIPLIPYDAVAGYGSPVYDDISVEEYYIVNEFRNCDFLLRIKGDSMAPKYPGGDLVACRRVEERLFFQWGRVYAVFTKSQGLMIKRVQPSEDKDCIKCVSDNAKYAPFDVPKSDIIALALVNGSISLE